jgi:hypothetical protein
MVIDNLAFTSLDVFAGCGIPWLWYQRERLELVA